MGFLSRLFGDANAKVISEIKPIVEKINALESSFQSLTDEQLKDKTAEFRERVKKGETLDDILPEAFAAVREASRRTIGLRHFDVQLIGGAVLHRGAIAEMRTGEGKTLVATLPTYLNTLGGDSVHVVTVNDYLAKRDAVWMGPVYDFLGLSVGIIQNQLVSYRYVKPPAAPEAGSETTTYKVEYEHLHSCTRQEAYQADIVYGTNNEFGFDYLRDNMAVDVRHLSQRRLAYAIVDEVDSILIDEARTPLIISAPAEEAADQYYQFAALVETLKENDDYNVDEKMRSATLTDAGIKKIETALGVENIYAEGTLTTVHHVEQALRAKALFRRDRDYVVEQGEVIIVDEFTGRKLPGRRYSEGLHQAIEAREGVSIQRESKTMATITFQNLFRLYGKLAGMTGTAMTEAEELGKIYNLDVVTIPTHRANRRVDHPDRIYKTEAIKFKAIALRVRELQEKGQPVLIGTVSVEKNEALSNYLEQEGIKHEILNAKNHEREGEIIAQAGRPGAVTLATNMAGRGVDIILGGNPPEADLAEKARGAGGLHVIGTERHESRRIDNQLRGRAARQGDPGETQFFLSTEDDLMRIFAGDRIRRAMQALRLPDDTPIEQRTITRIIESAQKKVEGFHFDSRKHLLEYDDIINRHREVIYGKRRAILEEHNRERSVLAGDNPLVAVEAAPETLRQMVLKMVEEEIEEVVSFHTNAEDRDAWNIKEVIETMSTIFPLTAAESAALEKYTAPGAEKLDAIRERTELIEHLVAMATRKYEEMLVKGTAEPGLLIELEKQILLRSIDTMWVDHLVAIDHLRTGIGLRGYAQRDPLVEYKKETYRMFHELLHHIRQEVVYAVYKIPIGLQLAPSIMEKEALTFQGATKEVNAPSGQTLKTGDTSGIPTVGRNEPCPCGSGKKYKRCHGAL